MKIFRALTSTALAIVSVSGCARLNLGLSQPQAPPLQTGQGTIDKQQQRSQQPAPPSTLPQSTAQTAPPPLPPLKPPKVKRFRKRRHKAQPAQTAESASATAPHSVGAASSPIGQLSTGGGSNGEQTRRTTLSLIDETQRGLAKVKDQHSKERVVTKAQIAVFLKQARQALDSGDTDGAFSLATKAKLLLDELTHQ